MKADLEEKTETLQSASDRRAEAQAQLQETRTALNSSKEELSASVKRVEELEGSLTQVCDGLQVLCCGAAALLMQRTLRLAGSRGNCGV